MASNLGKTKKYNFWQKLYFGIVPFRYRYDKTFRQTFDFLMQSQYWSRQELLDYQFSELQKLLRYSYKNVPYYTQAFNESGIHPSDIRSPQDIRQLPILTKQLVLKNRDKLISKAYTGKTVTFRTSGSTGERLEFLGEDSMYKKEAAFVLRSFKSHGADLYDKPSIWLRRYVPKTPGEPLWYYDYELKRLYMSAYHVTKDTVRLYVDAINATGSDILVGYPSSIYILACLLEESGLKLPQIKYIHVASEMVLDHWKKKVEKILGIQMKAHYGATERVAFMHQPNNSDNYCDNVEYGFTEFVKNALGDYDIVATGFLNRVMPLIRYNTGDTATLNPNDSAASGLPLSVLNITGRSDDILIAASGNRLPGVNFYTMMYKIDGVKMFQLIQKELGTLDVCLVLEKTADTQKVTDEVRTNLKNRLGNVDVRFALKDTIQRDPKTQKIRCIQCLINQ
jgi:phenylacetate-CoA ligase